MQRLSVAVTGLICLALFVFFASGIGRGADDVDERLIIVGVALFVTGVVVIRVGGRFRPGWNAYDDLSAGAQRRAWMALAFAVLAGILVGAARKISGF